MYITKGIGVAVSLIWLLTLGVHLPLHSDMKIKVGKLMNWTRLVQCKKIDSDRVNAETQESRVVFK